MQGKKRIFNTNDLTMKIGCKDALDQGCKTLGHFNPVLGHETTLLDVVQRRLHRVDRITAD